MDQIFDTLQAELSLARARFEFPRSRFSLAQPYNLRRTMKLNPHVALKMPDDSIVTAVVFAEDEYPAINLTQETMDRIETADIVPLFILNKVECGDNSQEHTVRDWLDSFGIPIVDQYYIRWQRIAMHASRVIKSVEGRWTSRGINMLLTLVFSVLYLGYDMKREFEPQFTERAEELRGILSKIESDMGGAANAG